MDYTGLINLALVTILYSTFIAPNLKKLGEQRDEIASTEFPLKNCVVQDDAETDKNIYSKGVDLDKKITQYEDKYSEIKIFLYFFYGILLILFTIQVVFIIMQKSCSIVQVLSLIGAGIVVIMLILTIKVYMVVPWKIRSIQWLSAKKIAPVYTNFLLMPRLVFNGIAANHTYNNDEIRFSIRTKSKFTGYRYIFIIESKNYKHFYHLTAGTIGKYTYFSPLTYSNGDLGYEIMLAKTKLKIGLYNARILIFNAPFGGNVKIAETVINFDVNDETAKNQEKKINLTSDKSHYTFTSNKNTRKQKISKIDFEESFDGDNNISTVLTSKRFLAVFKRLNRPFVINKKDGAIDRYEIQRLLSRRNLLIRRFLHVVTLKFRKSPYLLLTKKISKK